MSRPGGRQSRSAILAPLAVALIWGVNVPVMKAGLAELDPFLFNAARLSLSALSLGLFSLREPRGGGRRTPQPAPCRKQLCGKHADFHQSEPRRSGSGLGGAGGASAEGGRGSGVRGGGDPFTMCGHCRSGCG